MNLCSKRSIGRMNNGMNSDESESSSSSDTDSGSIGGSGRITLVQVKLDVIVEVGKSKHLREKSAVNRSGSSAHSRTASEISNGSGNQASEGIAKEEVPSSPTKKHGSQSSISLNASELPDLFQVDAGKINQSETRMINLADSHRGIQLELEDDESCGSSVSSIKSDKSNGSRGPKLASQVSDCAHEPVITYQSPTQSPPVQRMDRIEGYDPLRIPSSVFQRTISATPLEWSVASNESLFSIHVGNTSFSRDHVFLLGDLGKAADTTRAGDFIVSNPPPEATPPTVPERKVKELENEPKTAEIAVANATIKDSESLDAQTGRQTPPPAVLWDSSNITPRSDGSESSTNSFAFPILADEVQRQSSATDAKKKHQESPHGTVSSNSRGTSWFSCCGLFRSCSCCSSCSLCCSGCALDCCFPCDGCHSCRCCRCCSCFRCHSFHNYCQFRRPCHFCC